jgi:hypothetical protein
MGRKVEVAWYDDANKRFHVVVNYFRKRASCFVSTKLIQVAFRIMYADRKRVEIEEIQIDT